MEDGRDVTINALKIKIFSLYHESRYEDIDEDEDGIRDKNGIISYKKLDRLISLKERGMNDEVVRKHFLVQNLRRLLGKLRELKNTKKPNRIQITFCRSELRDLKEEIKENSEDEKEIKQTNEFLKRFLSLMIKIEKGQKF